MHNNIYQPDAMVNAQTTLITHEKQVNLVCTFSPYTACTMFGTVDKNGKVLTMWSRSPKIAYRLFKEIIVVARLTADRYTKTPSKELLGGLWPLPPTN